MSLIRIAARICAVQALKGKTLVGDNVLDSQIGALDVTADGDLRSDADRPFISVYTDAAKSSDNRLRSWTLNGTTDFLFEMGVTAAHLERNSETGESVIYPGIPGTDANFEFLLDIVARQIGDALSNPENSWAELFRRFVASTEKVERARTSGDGSGVRLATQQIKISVDLLADPVRGVALKAEHPLSAFFSAVAGLNDPVLDAQVALMQSQLSGDETELQTALRRYGLTVGEATSMQFAPADGSLIGDVVAAPE